MDNMLIWEQVRKPPKTALKQFNNGRFKGTDISPQWRCQIMTEIFGPIGIGWSYRTIRLWTEDGVKGEKCAFAEIALRVKWEDKWSHEIEGNGGSMMITNETRGPRTNDEAYKMATTDALGVAMKQLGVAADIYLGNYDGSKYKDEVVTTPSSAKKATPPQKKMPSQREVYKDVPTPITRDDVVRLCALMTKKKVDEDRFKVWLADTYQLGSRNDIPKMLYYEIYDYVEAKK